MSNSAEFRRPRVIEEGAHACADNLDALFDLVRDQELELGQLRGRITVLERDLRRAEQRLGLLGRVSAMRRRGFVTVLRGRAHQRAR